MIRVLIVDDSPTIRTLIRAILESDPDIAVVGEACDGQEAVHLCRHLEPDIVTTDIHMPVKDGYHAIREIMSESPRPIVVLTSTESDIRLDITHKAIDTGALMVINKPHDLPGQDPEADELIAQIKAMADVKVVRRRYVAVQNPVSKSRQPRRKHGRLKILALGASTGGPPAIKAVFERLPVDFCLPILVVQHISRGFVEGLTRWLNSTTPIVAKVAENGEICKPGCAYFAPDGCHLEVFASGRIRLSHTEAVDGHKPSVTVLFNSVAENYGASAAGVILTGMGHDGASGLKRMRDAGAYTIAQDKTSSVVFGMSKEAIAVGSAVEILPLTHVGTRIRDLAAADTRMGFKKYTEKNRRMT